MTLYLYTDWDFKYSKHLHYHNMASQNFCHHLWLLSNYFKSECHTFASHMLYWSAWPLPVANKFLTFPGSLSYEHHSIIDSDTTHHFHF